MIDTYIKVKCDMCKKALKHNSAMLPKGWISINISEMFEIGPTQLKKDCCSKKCAYKLLKEFKFPDFSKFEDIL